MSCLINKLVPSCTATSHDPHRHQLSPPFAVQSTACPAAVRRTPIHFLACHCSDATSRPSHLLFPSPLTSPPERPAHAAGGLTSPAPPSLSAGHGLSPADEATLWQHWLQLSDAFYLLLKIGAVDFLEFVAKCALMYPPTSPPPSNHITWLIAQVFRLDPVTAALTSDVPTVSWCPHCKLVCSQLAVLHCSVLHCSALRCVVGGSALS